jgi:uncharacterized protein
MNLAGCFMHLAISTKIRNEFAFVLLWFINYFIKEMSDMKIWVDIANSPQVLFMSPIITELQKRGHALVVTTRQHSETVSLADHFGFSHTVIGVHGGGTLIGKGLAIVIRALRLIWFLRHQHIDLAVSGSSFSQALAVKWMHTPLVAFNDYEGNPGMHIICRVARKIFVPNVFSKQNLYRYGASEDQIESYNGLKENIYLGEFVPDHLFLEKAGIPQDKILVTMRPASDVSAYHQFENPLFEEALNYIAHKDNTFIILLSRNAKQREKYEALGLPNVLLPSRVLDGPNLIYYSDLIVGAGGTMNREAVVLGSSVYSLFMGMLGSIDQRLIDSGKLIWIKNSSEIQKIKITKKINLGSNFQQDGQNLVAEIVSKILKS